MSHQIDWDKVRDGLQFGEFILRGVVNLALRVAVVRLIWLAGNWFRQRINRKD